MGVCFAAQTLLLLHTLQVEFVLVEETVQCVDHLPIPCDLLLVRQLGLELVVAWRVSLIRDIIAATFGTT